MAPIPAPQTDPDPMGMGAEGMPDLSHLSEEERQIILQVLQRQKAEEQQEEEIAQKGDKELWDIERQIQEKKENAQRLIGTQDDAICQICQKTKFADGIGHKCFYCQLRSCARCGGKTTSKNKNIWACSLCQKRQQILARTGKWFQQPQKEQQGQIGTTTSPVNTMPPSPMIDQQEEKELRKPSLPQKTSISQSSAVALSPSGLNRQGSLRRQISLEEQMPTMNGEKMQQTSRANGQMKKTNGNQREGGELQRQRSIRQQQQQSQQQMMGRQQSAPQHPQSTSSHFPRLLPSVEDPPSTSSNQHFLQNLRPSTAGQISNRPKEAGGQQHRQRSMEDGHPNRQSSRPDHPQHRRPPTSSTPFVPALPGQQPPPPPTSSRQSSTVAPPIFAGGPSPMRTRRAKAGKTVHQQPPPQPHRSYSSSDDELSSPKQQNTSISQLQGGGQLPQSASLQLESTNTKLEPDFSEKELLRYIYDNAHPNAKRVATSARGGPFFGHQAHSLDAASTLTNAQMSSTAPSTMAAVNSLPSYHNILAQRIRNYLSNPSVSWQPSVDQRHLIGHIVLYKPYSLALMNLPNSSTAQGFNSLDFGLKVVGGRNPSNGRLGAFVSRVRPGSVADTVGQLRAGDEVLKWNGHSLQNLTPEGVYNIVQSTKGDSRLELIVSRPISGDADDFLNLRRLRDQHQELGGIGPSSVPLPHSQSMSSPFAHNFAYNQPQQRFPPPQHSRRAPSPLVLHAGGATFFDAMPVNVPPPMAFPSSSSTDADPRICGRLEMALLYLAQKRELIISLSRAYDLVPRSDANNPLRNPYVKLFLLPDRSERSRRQSKILSETLNPIWDEHFFYEDLDEVGLAGRVLEITLWDFDPYESHSFLGEALVEIGQAQLNNQPFLYNLLNMDEENPIRMRLRQRRYSSMTPPVGHRSRSQMSYSRQKQSSFGNNNNFNERRKISDNYGNTSHSIHNLAFHASRHRGGGFPLTIGNEAFWQTAEEDWNRNGGGDEDWNQIGGGWTKRGGVGGKVQNGYLSDQEQEWEMERRRRNRGGEDHHRRKEHRHQHHRSGGERGNVGRGGGGGEHRRPQSATALRNIAEWELRHNNNGGGGNYDEPPEEEFNRQNNSKLITNNNRKTTRQQILKEQEGGGAGGYGSDGSVETLSVNSAQSMQNRALLRQQQIQRIRDQQQQISHRSSNEEMDPRGQLVVEDEEEVIGMDRLMMQGGQGGQKGGQALSVKEMKERKKSLMTRLIPGRNGPNDANKRLGFARSEEVGIPLGEAAALAPPEQNRDFIKQNSKESTDSSDNWLPILPDRPLGSFMDNLGPGQVVGRQALGSSPLGELHAGLAIEPGTGLIVDVKEARGLKATGAKGMAPATYVKAYLMDGKNCMAKAKTQPSKSRSASPSFRQKLVFGENPKHKMLQLTVIGDFGRIERKSFMGVVQIALDELQLGREQLDGWFKLFHSASLNGSAQPPGSTNSAGIAIGNGGGEGPSRKESEVSLN